MLPYQNYRKYEFPARKLHMDDPLSRNYNYRKLAEVAFRALISESFTTKEPSAMRKSS